MPNPYSSISFSAAVSPTRYAVDWVWLLFLESAWPPEVQEKVYFGSSGSILRSTTRRFSTPLTRKRVSTQEVSSPCLPILMVLHMCQELKRFPEQWSYTRSVVDLTVNNSLRSTNPNIFIRPALRATYHFDGVLLEYRGFQPIHRRSHRLNDNAPIE